MEQLEINKTDKSRIAFVTGHRPDKLFGYNLSDERYAKIREWFKEQFIKNNIEEVYVGMALGTDMDVCQAVLELKQAGVDIKLHACVAFKGVERKWNSVDAQRFRSMLDKADKVTLVNENTWYDGCTYLTDRNHYMVDNAGIGFAVINNGIQKTKLNRTGTMECIKYAKKKGLDVEIFDANTLINPVSSNQDEEVVVNKKKSSAKRKPNTISLETLDLWYNSDNFIVMDLETTGYSYKSGSRIIDIGAYELKDNVLISKYEQLVNPGCNIPYNITQLTGINDIMVKRKPNILQVFNVVINYVGDKPVIFHNAKFDYGAFLEPMCKSMLGRDLNWKVLCTFELAKMIVKSDKKDLATLYKLLTGKEVNNQAHRASADALMTAEIALIMQKYIKDNYETLRKELKIKLGES